MELKVKFDSKKDVLKVKVKVTDRGEGLMGLMFEGSVLISKIAESYKGVLLSNDMPEKDADAMIHTMIIAASTLDANGDVKPESVAAALVDAEANEEGVSIGRLIGSMLGK